MNYKNHIFKLFILLTVPFSFTNCEPEQVETSPQTTTIENQNISKLSTIPIKETIEYIKNIENNHSYARELELDVDLESIRQEDITNTDAKINIIDATTQYENIETTIMQIEIDGTAQTILFNVIPETTTNTTSEPDLFSGNIVITNLSGIVLNNFQYSSGNLLGEIDLNYYTSNNTDPCWGITCGIDLDTVYLSNAPSTSNWAYINYANTTNVMMNYQFVRSTNNYSSMGIAYSNYYASVYGPIIAPGSDNPINDIQDFLDCFDNTQNATLTVYALEPNPGSGDTSVGRSVGHAFISISQGNSTSVYGYYPVSNWINPWNTSGSSELGNDSNNSFSSSITTTISGSQLKQINNASINFNQTYNLNNYNCTDFVIEMGNLGGLNLPPSDGTWINGGNGSNPGTLGQEIRNRNQQQGQTINTNGGNSPVTNKGC